MIARIFESRRGMVAAAVIVLWLVGLGALVHREYMSSPADRMAEAGRRVNPGAFYYAVERDGEQVGYLSSQIDTFPASIALVDVANLEVPSGDSARELGVSSRVELTRSLALTTFTFAVTGGAIPLVVDGMAEGDSTLLLVVRGDEAAAIPQRLASTGPVVPPSLVPLLVALAEQPEVGRRVPLSLYDPAQMTVRPVVVRIEADSLFTFSDSAHYNPAVQQWEPAFEDTVRAWHVVTEGDSSGFNAWVDAQGRVVAARYPGGFTLRRMAFEEAVTSWRNRARE